MKKGIVMDFDNRSVTILTPEGEFLKVHKEQQNYQLGAEISYDAVREQKTPRIVPFSKKAAGILALAAALLLFTILPFTNTDEVYAYVSIDVNPSMELAIDKDMKVIQIKANNKEAELLLKEMENWKGKDFQTVSTHIIDLIKEDGYLANKPEIIIGTVIIGTQKEITDQNLSETIYKIEETLEPENVQIDIVQATESKRKEAIEAGSSVGMFVKKEQEEKSAAAQSGNDSIDQPADNNEDSASPADNDSTPNNRGNNGKGNDSDNDGKNKAVKDPNDTNITNNGKGKNQKEKNANINGQNKDNNNGKNKEGSNSGKNGINKNNGNNSNKNKETNSSNGSSNKEQGNNNKNKDTSNNNNSNNRFNENRAENSLKDPKN